MGQVAMCYLSTYSLHLHAKMCNVLLAEVIFLAFFFNV